MLVEASSLLNLPIISLDSGNTIGFVGKLIIDPTNGKVLGFLVPQGFLRPPRVVAFNEIYEWDLDSIKVRDDEAIVSLEEVIRIKRIVEEEIDILGSEVITTSGKKLGRVKDFVINSDSGSLIRLYVESQRIRDYFGNLLVIPASRIIKIERGKIIINEETFVEEYSEEAVGEPAVT